MAESSYGANLDLLCDEDADICHDAFWHHQELSFDNLGESASVKVLLQSEERVKEMVEREREHLPRDDYLKRLRSGDLDLSFRREAIDWIFKVYTHFSFRPLCISLAVNYLDRFLSTYQLPRGKSWSVQLASVACLSLAAKMEEKNVPKYVDLQVGEPIFVFESKSIGRMESLVLNTLKWKMQAITPCSYIDYFLSKNLDIDLHHSSLKLSLSKSVQLILSMIKGIDFLEFRPSEIAAAVAILISGEIEALERDKENPCFVHVEKGRVMKCVELIKDFSLITRMGNRVLGSESPAGVLDAACLSYKSDELTTVGSCANSSHGKREREK